MLGFLHGLPRQFYGGGVHICTRFFFSNTPIYHLEDAVAGIEAALAANMKCIGYLGGGIIDFSIIHLILIDLLTSYFFFLFTLP